MTATTTTEAASGATPPPHPSETVRDLPLSALTLSERNVRTIDDTPEEMAILKASILSHGLIENLAVRFVDDRYEVIAGRRRFRAMRELVDAGEVHPDMMVACRILDEFTNDTEISLAENEARVAMHPVDQVTAFRRLTTEGVDRDRIAERFGVSARTVDQRLRLGGLPAPILDAAREGELSLEHLHAFAATADAERQLEVWNRVKGESYTPGAHWIRTEVTRRNVSATHSRARFVGIDAYTAAGGRIEADLFSDGEDERAMLVDADLLDRLAADKLQQVADDLKAQGWKWAEPHLDLEWDAAQSYGRVRGTSTGPTEEQAAELKRVEKRIAEIDEEIEGMRDQLDEHDDDPPEDHPYWKLSEERDRLMNDENHVRVAIDRNVTWSPEQMACAGCLVSLDQFEGLTVEAGLVRKEDARDVPQAAPRAGEESGEAAGEPHGHPGDALAGYTPPVKRTTKNPEVEAVKSAGLSTALAEDMRLIRNGLVKAHLAHDFEAAFDLAAYEMSLHAFSIHVYGTRPLAMTLNATSNQPMGSPEEHAAFEAASPGIGLLERDQAELSLDWMRETDAARRFLAFTELPLGDRQRLFSAATARALNKQLSFDHGSHPEFEATVARLEIPFEAVWRPGLERFWSRMRKGEMLAVARRTLGPEWAAAHDKDKKDELAAAMAGAFGPDGEAEALGLSTAARAAALGWTPSGFRAFDPARPPEKDAPKGDGATPAAPPEPEPGNDATKENAGTPAEAAGAAEPDDTGTAGAEPAADDTINGSMLGHPLSGTENGNGNGVALDESTGEDDTAETFDHRPADELPAFLQK